MAKKASTMVDEPEHIDTPEDAVPWTLGKRNGRLVYQGEVKIATLHSNPNDPPAAWRNAKLVRASKELADALGEALTLMQAAGYMMTGKSTTKMQKLYQDATGKPWEPGVIPINTSTTPE